MGYEMNDRFSNKMRESAANHKSIPIPASFVFEATRRCNHDCLHCYNVWKNPIEYPRGELSTGETLDMLDGLLRETGAGLVSLSGGEPMLREDFFEIVEFLNERGVAINLITNGSLLTETAIERLRAGAISLFELPLLSAEREVHDRLSGSAGAFDRATEAMADLKLGGQAVVGVFVATRLNLPGFEKSLELALALGLDGLMLNRFNPGGRGCENVELLQADPRELRSALDTAERIGREHGLPIACSIAMPPCLFDTRRYRWLNFGFCAVGTERAYYCVDPLGNLRPCNHSPTILGNVRRTGFGELINGRRMRDYVRALPEFCRACRLADECMGGCKAAAEACYGSERELEPFLRAFRHRARPIRA